MSLVGHFDQSKFLDTLAQENKWVLDTHNDELERVFKPLVANADDLSQDFVAVYEVFEVIMMVFP